MINRLIPQIHDDRLARLSAAAAAGVLPSIVLIGVALAAFVFQPFGQREFAFVAIAGTLGLIVFGPLLSPSIRATTRTGPARGLGRSLRVSRCLLVGGLITWLALIAVSSVSTGGAMPPSKSANGAVRVLTWNILHGRDRGPPWEQCGWKARKKAIEAALAATKPEIFCVQEALAEQVDALAAMVPEHEHVGVGRDDGRSAGEFCAIFYDTRRFAIVKTGTFWLEEPTDEPRRGLTLGPKRICTWARILDQTTGRFLRVYNTHLYLTEKARQRAVRVIVGRIAAGDPNDAILVAGDFNAAPGAPSRRVLEESGLVSTAELASAAQSPTYHFYGIRLRALDEIFCSEGSRVAQRRVLDVKPANTYPSDHFGVMADVSLRP